MRTWRALAPPVDEVAVLLSVRERIGGAQQLRTGRAAEPPQILRRLLVAVDEIIELELVDRPGVQLREAVSHVLEEDAQLAPVVTRRLLRERSRGGPCRRTLPLV